MAAVVKRYQEHVSLLRKQASFRSGDEKAILLGWSGLLEHHIGRLLAGKLNESDLALAVDALDDAWIKSWRHLDDIRSSKAPPHVSAEEREAARLRYAAIVADAPWNLPNAVKPKGQWGGKRS